MNMITIKSFVENNDCLISFFIGIFGLALSALGVYFGKKAYRVAQDIFDRGLQIDKQKILSQISLEFVTGFVIPFSNFKIATQAIWANPIESQSVSSVRDILKNNAFEVTFPYWDVHKGDVWDSLAICKDMKQEDAFNSIVEFVKMAKQFDRGINDLYTYLDRYLEPDSSKNLSTATLEEFFIERPNVNKELFNKGINMLKEVDIYLEKLPRELNISEMKMKLYRN